MFSELLGIGLSLLGGSRANDQAQAQYDAMMKQIELQRQQQEMLYRMAMEAQYQQDTRNDELRSWEQWARNSAMDERLWQIDELNKYTSQLTSERQYEIDRQIMADQEAAKIQAFRMEQMLRNQNLSEQERAYAVKAFEEARAVAAGERQDDLRMYYENKLKAEAQRDFMMGVYGDARATAQSERNADLAIRDNIMRQIEGMTGAVQAAYDSFGAAPRSVELTQADIDTEIARRQDQYQSDVDRATSAIGSQNEAALIGGGMDRSSMGTQMRGDVASRMADEYQSARDRAYDDAMKFITGKVSALNSNVGDIMSQRGRVLQEIMGAYGAGISPMSNLPSVSSAMGGYNTANLVGDGVYDRAIVSANNYQPPINIGSGIYDSDLYTMMSGIAPNMVQRSAASPSFFNIESSVTNPQNLLLSDPGGYMGMYGQIGSNILSGLAGSYQYSQDRADDMVGSPGTAFANWLNDNSGTVDGWFGWGKK
jgi:hypothetical protein